MPGNDVDSLVESCCQLLQPEALRVFPVGRSGVIIWLAGQGEGASDAFCRGFGLHRAGGAPIFLPQGTRLAPPMTDEEMTRVAGTDCVVVLPGNRWLRFDLSGGISPSRLVMAPRARPGCWNRAVSPEPPPPRLERVQAARLPDPEDSVGGGREDIGSDNPEKLAGGGRGEKSSRDPRAGLFRSILELTRKFPEKSGIEPTWVNRVEAWAARNLDRITERQRQEMEKLIDLLRTDPDQGLKFALPLTGGRGRGAAPPADSLSQRNVDFTLGRLFGSGQAISPWMVDPAHYRDLQKGYRDAANRELSLGRFRRAAYIFAELLGDMRAAANALEQGRFFSEAAVVYERKLRDPGRAAEVYRKAGRFEDALRLYRVMERHEERGELLRELGREPAAEDAFCLAMNVHLAAGRRLEAARVAEVCLGDVDRAIDICREGWPLSGEAEECLGREIALLADRRDHEEATNRFRELAGGDWSEQACGALIRNLTWAKRDYPDAETARIAGDCARVAAGRHLARPHASRASLLQHVPDFEPADRLLFRDAKRFGRRKIAADQAPPASPGPVADEDISLIKVYRRTPQPPHSFPVAACGFGGRTVTASLSGRGDAIHLVVSDSSSGVTGSVTHSLDSPARRAGFFRVIPLDHYPGARNHALFYQDETENELPFLPLSGPSEVVLTAGNSGLHSVLGAVSSDSGFTWTLSLGGDGEFVLEASSERWITETHHLGVLFPAESGAARFLPMASSGNRICFAVGSRIFCWQRGGLCHLDLPYPVHDLTANSQAVHPCIAAPMEHGVALIWDGQGDWEDGDSGLCRIIRESEPRPRVAFLPGNHLVVAGGETICVFSVAPREVRCLGEWPLPKRKRVLAVVPQRDAREFEVVTVSEIFGMRMERRGLRGE